MTIWLIYLLSIIAISHVSIVLCKRHNTVRLDRNNNNRPKRNDTFELERNETRRPKRNNRPGSGRQDDHKSKRNHTLETKQNYTLGSEENFIHGLQENYTIGSDHNDNTVKQALESEHNVKEVKQTLESEHDYDNEVKKTLESEHDDNEVKQVFESENNDSEVKKTLESEHDDNEEKKTLESDQNDIIGSVRNHTDDSDEKVDLGTKRIVGGTAVGKNDYPFFAYPNSSGMCGATVIYGDILMTAAHCGTDLWSSGVWVGGNSINLHNGKFFEVNTSIIHPLYNPMTLEHDIQLIKINGYISPPYSKLNFDASIPKDGQELTAIGYGTTKEGGKLSKKLQKVNFFTVGYEECNQTYGDELYDDIMVCNGGIAEGGKDTCQGDSGGPIFLANTTIQIGLVSFGDGCARPGVPAINARVSAFEDFITEWICRLSADKPKSCPDTNAPFAAPTGAPTMEPTPEPTNAPVIKPTKKPVKKPVKPPVRTKAPSSAPRTRTMKPRKPIKKTQTVAISGTQNNNIVAGGNSAMLSAALRAPLTSETNNNR